MDYEKKYKEALGWMQSLYKGLHGATKEDAEHYFPELKESDDERIKKAITRILYENYTDAAVIKGVEIAEIVAWLEKQSEQKPTWSEEDELNLKQAIYVCHQNGYAAIENWIKSLKPQPQWKPTEQQMNALKQTSENDYVMYNTILKSLYNDLKKL